MMSNSSDIGVYNTGWVPNVKGWINFLYHNNSTVASGMFSKVKEVKTTIGAGNYLSEYEVKLDASSVNSIFSDNVTSVFPPNLIMLYIIKY